MLADRVEPGDDQPLADLDVLRGHRVILERLERAVSIRPDVHVPTRDRYWYSALFHTATPDLHMD